MMGWVILIRAAQWLSMRLGDLHLAGMKMVLWLYQQRARRMR